MKPPIEYRAKAKPKVSAPIRTGKEFAKDLNLPPETTNEWKAKLEAMRAKTRERVRRHRAKKRRNAEG